MIYLIVAEVGGYLGLILGVSLMDLYKLILTICMPALNSLSKSQK